MVLIVRHFALLGARSAPLVSKQVERREYPLQEPGGHPSSAGGAGTSLPCPRPSTRASCCAGGGGAEGAGRRSQPPCGH